MCLWDIFVLFGFFECFVGFQFKVNLFVGENLFFVKFDDFEDFEI